MKGFVREDLQNQMCVACSDPLYTTREEGRVNPNHHDNEAEDCVIRESNNVFLGDPFTRERSVYTCRFLARLMLLCLTACFLISIVSMVTG